MRGSGALTFRWFSFALASVVAGMAVSGAPNTSAGPWRIRPAFILPSLLPARPHTPAQSVAYTLLPDRLLILSEGRGRAVERTVLVGRARLAMLARKLYLLCSDPSSPEREWRLAARELAGYLIAPIEDDLEPNVPLSVDLDDALSAVPLTVLPARSGQPFGEKFAVRLVAGTPVVRPAPLTTAGPMLAVGVSAVSAGEETLLPLPDAVAEARDAAAHFADARLLLNRDATVQQIERDLTQAAAFHFAGHARQTAGGAALVSGAQDITASELAHMDLSRCQLAVISTCSAEPPQWGGKPHRLGLASALLEAGAAGVLATRWQLDSAAARLYTQAFYDRLASGAEASKAAQAAAFDIRRTPGFEHPFYWAAFQYFLPR